MQQFFKRYQNYDQNKILWKVKKQGSSRILIFRHDEMMQQKQKVQAYLYCTCSALLKLFE